MLVLDPRGVRMDRLAPEGDFKTTGATGDASRATSFKGEAPARCASRRHGGGAR
jgi:hypothetical protein